MVVTGFPGLAAVCLSWRLAASEHKTAARERRKNEKGKKNLGDYMMCHTERFSWSFRVLG
jgi:hypothetical protein